MRKRAEHVGRTRQRITEAAMRLHTTVGPSEASLSAIAEEAGVTRLTLYRHFASMDELFGACMGHWRTLHPPPDPEAWRRIPFEQRLRHGLADLYRWYGENGDDLFPINRDSGAVPQSAHRAWEMSNTMRVDALLDGRSLRGAAGRRLRAAAGHAIAFWTWRSLVVDQGLSTAEAVELAVGFVAAAGGGKPIAIRSSRRHE